MVHFTRISTLLKIVVVLGTASVLAAPAAKKENQEKQSLELAGTGGASLAVVPSTAEVTPTAASSTTPIAESTPTDISNNATVNSIEGTTDAAAPVGGIAAPIANGGISPDTLLPSLIQSALSTLGALSSTLVGSLSSLPPAAGGAVGGAIPGIASINAIPVEKSPPAASIAAVVPKTVNVTIGDGATRFTPAIIKANPGDTLMFNWLGKNNHSVTETDTLGSCTKSSSPTAFDSGVQAPGTVWSLTIPADARGLKFFYCKVLTHCVVGGMSGTIITPE